MIQKPFRGAQVNRMHPLAEGLVGCWLFNEATGETAFDLSGHGNNGTLENGVAWGSDGLEFDGDNDYVDCGDIADLGDTFTFSALINQDTTPDTYNGLIVRDGDTTANASFRLNNSNQIEIRQYAVETVSSTGTITNEQRTHVVASVSNKVVTFYINGKNVGGGTFAGSFNDTGNIRIGKYTGVYFDGFINFVSIYSQAKSAEEVVWLYREPYAMFEPSFNPALLYSAVPPVGAIMNQFQRVNLGADLYNGVFA